MRNKVLLLMFMFSVLSLYPQEIGLTASVFRYPDKVELKWHSSSISSEGLKYYVYRIAGNGAQKLLTPGGVSSVTYSDTSVSPGTAFWYTVRAVTPGGQVYQSRRQCGVGGVIPQPQVEVIPGPRNNVLLRMKNRPSYLKVNISVSRPYYQPVYRLKEAYGPQYGNHVVSEHSSVPFNYEDSLCYALNPNRKYTSPAYICRNSPWDEVSDNDAAPGINRYTVQYTYTLPDGKERLSDFATIGGFRSVSDREFLDEVLMTVERSQFKLNLIHRGGTAPNGFDAVEDDTKNDNALFVNEPKNPPQGWLYYDCEFSLRKMLADVTLIYQKYRDYDLTLTTDKKRMHRSLVGPEKITNINNTKVGDLIGVVLVEGIYSGEVEFHLKIGNRNAKLPYTPGSPFYSATQQTRFFYSGKKGPGQNPDEPGRGSFYIVRRKKNGAVVSQSIFAWDYDREQTDSRLLRLRK
ncbi:MAG: hypothetical protein SOZ27_05480 [Spirochaetia bacterium]|nr:hypothetical protein [Spirochaetia bacterium]